MGLNRACEGGERRYGSNRDVGRVRNFKVKDVEWVVEWVEAQEREMDGDSEGSEEGDKVEGSDAGGGDSKVGRKDEMGKCGDVRFVEGADTALALLGAQFNPPVDEYGRIKVMAVWMHSMDVLAPQNTPESSSNVSSEVGEDEEGDDHDDRQNYALQEYHCRGLLLDTKYITVGKFLHQLDTLIIQEYPCNDWAFLKLCKVELGACDDDELNDENADPASEQVLECLEDFVGYEFVGEEVARAVRDAWERDYWRAEEVVNAG